MKIIKSIKDIISQINNDEDLSFLGSKHPIIIMGMILLALVGTIIGLACLQILEPYDKTVFDETRIEKGNRNYTENFKLKDIDIAAQVEEIQQDVKGMAAAVVGIKADMKAFFFGAKFGLENRFEFPLRFGGNGDDSQRPTFPNQDVASAKGQEVNTDSVNPDKPSKHLGEKDSLEPSNSEKSGIPAKSGKPSKSTSQKPAKKEDCPDVKIVILKDTCNCGGIVIDTLTFKR